MAVLFPVAHDSDHFPSNRKAALFGTVVPYAVAFFAPFAILLAAFVQLGIYPFGDVSVMLYDMPVQYAEYFGWLIQVLHGQGNLLYSNAAGLGGGMFSLFTYYLSSPFNLLAWFFTPETVPQLFSLLYLVKIPTCALTCLVFLRGRFLAPHAASVKEARATIAQAPAMSQAALVALACAYSLTSYVLGYANNIMWLDGVIMLPLAALGTYRLVQRRNAAGLFVAVTCAVLFNWYTGYMVCLFCVLYFFYELARATNLKGQRLRRCLSFATTMLLAVGASMVVLLPTALSLLGGKGANAGLSSLFDTTKIARSPLSLGSLFCIGTLPGITTQANRPALVLSALVLVLAAAFLFSKRSSRIDRITGFSFAALMLASVIIQPLATIWSGFVPESSYTNRNGFAILFVLVMLAAQGVDTLRAGTRRESVRTAVIGGLFAFASVLGSIPFSGNNTLSYDCITYEGFFIACFTALLALLAGASNANEVSHARIRPGQAKEPLSAMSVIDERYANAKPSATSVRGCAVGTVAHQQPAATAVRRIAPKATVIALCFLLAFAFALEQLTNAKAQLAPCRYSVSGYAEDLDNLQTFYAALEGSSFTRVGNTVKYWTDGSRNGDASKTNGPDNMALLLAYSTFDHYSSTQETRIQELLHYLGYSKVTPFGTYYMGPNTVADAVLGITDIASSLQPAGCKPTGSQALRGCWRWYSNDLALPLGWGCKGTGQVDWADERPFDNQNSLLCDAANSSETVFEAAAIAETQEPPNESRTFLITPVIDGPVYLNTPTVFMNDLYYDGGITCNVELDGTFVQTVGGRGSCNVVCLGEGKASKTMQLTITPLANSACFSTHKDGRPADTQHDFWDVDASDLLQVVSVDVGSLSEQLSRIKAAGSFALTAYENGHIAATFDAAQNETLVISQPYENGWSVTVNGQPAELEPAYEGLMGVQVPAGENTIELRYLTPGLMPGAIVSIASVTLFGVWRAATRKRSMGARQS